jgi:LmbE family N-acetylglucosaminyl deacetylase
MLKCLFNKAPDEDFTILCLGAHSDDIEIGCGGTILHLINVYKQINITWIVFSAKQQRAAEAYASAAAFLRDAQEKKVIIKEYQDRYFPYIGAQIKDYFEQIKIELSPDLIFTHYRNDLHQDHRLINELTWNTFRNHLILEYEIPKYDGDLGSPNFYVELDETIAKQKVDYLIDYYKSQTDRHWFTEDTFYSLLRLRGVESNAPHRYAEAFYGRKIVL